MSGDPIIETEGLSKRYGRTWALREMDLRVERGQVCGLLGPNGAGKSTTIRVLTGLVGPTGGRARLFGQPVGARRHGAGGVVGVAVEEPALYNYLSGRENLELLAALSGDVSERAIAEALELVGLSGREDDKVSTYSHGMRRRLYLAQALLPEPELLILDEPASGLDPRGLVLVRDLLHRLNQQRGVTIFLSSHLLHEIEQLCTHLAIIAGGRLVAQGPVEELLSGAQVRLEVYTSNPRRALSLLGAYHGVEQARAGPKVVELYCTPYAVADINEMLVAEGLRVFGLIPHHETLEDLYMRLTEDHEAAHDADN